MFKNDKGGEDEKLSNIDILVVNFWWNTTTQPSEEGFSKMRKDIMVRLYGCYIGNFPYIF
jgi:hypothetical protein